MVHGKCMSTTSTWTVHCLYIFFMLENRNWQIAFWNITVDFLFWARRPLLVVGLKHYTARYSRIDNPHDFSHTGFWWFSLVVLKSIQGWTHRATEGLWWLSMSRYWCIERVSASVGTLLCCDNGHSAKWLLMKRCFFGFDWIQTCLIFPLRWACFPINICRNTQWELFFDVFRWLFYHLPHFLV